MRPSRILILGGTRDARELAAALIAEGRDVITSLAGVTENPVLPLGDVRRGGFGGVEGLVRYLRDNAIAAIADATHPFAAQMSAQAAAAARQARIPILRLERPQWQPQDGDRWIMVQTAAEAVAALPAAARVLLTTGRKELETFLARSDVSGIARMIERPGRELPDSWTLLLDRPPYSVEGEAELITRHAITHVVTKNAGGDDTSAKLTAARLLQQPVVMIARPPKPEVPVFPAVKEFIPSLRRVLLP